MTYAGEGFEYLDIGREVAAVVVYHQPGGLLERECTAVVAHALPGEQQVALWCAGKALEVRELLKEPGVSRANPLDLCLLEHDLGYEDMIGVGGFPPGEVAAVSAVVGEDQVLEEAGGLPGASFLPDRLEKLVLVGIEGANHA